MRSGEALGRPRDKTDDGNFEQDEAKDIFDQAYLVDQKNDDPEQFRAIGWCGGRLCSVIFEIRYDAEGEYYRLVRAWEATKEEEQSYAENV
jgi:uncharacterized DUF497 family protein